MIGEYVGLYWRMLMHWLHVLTLRMHDMPRAYLTCRQYLMVVERKSPKIRCG